MIYLVELSFDYTNPFEELNLDNLSSENAKHLKALRPDVGEEVAFLNLKGVLAIYVVSAIKPLSLKFEKIIEAPLPARRTHLFLAPPSDSALEQAVEQATEIGYDEIHFIRTEHVQVPKGKSLPFARLNRIVQAACKQCGRVWAPVIREDFLPLDTILSASAELLRICADESSAKAAWGSITGSLKIEPLQEIGIFIGPEGGWSASERERLRNAAQIFSLGPYVLRVPTAVVSAYALCWKELAHGQN